MKNFYLDTEFNGFCGRLISMAIVSEDLSSEFYEVLDETTYCNYDAGLYIDPWVLKNVIPNLNKESISVKEFQDKLQIFLIQNSENNKIRIIADWPEDLTHFCKMLITAPGRRLEIPDLELIFDSSIEYTSKIPHNALEDARAIAKGQCIKQQSI